MGKFHDLLASVGVGEDGTSVAYPDTFMDDITAAYEEDFAGPTAAISVKDAEIAALNQKILELQAHNYELLMQIPVTPTDPNPDGEQDDASDDEDSADPLDEVFGN